MVLHSDGQDNVPGMSQIGYMEKHVSVKLRDSKHDSLLINFSSLDICSFETFHLKKLHLCINDLTKMYNTLVLQFVKKKE